jgi:hypothetical protein
VIPSARSSKRSCRGARQGAPQKPRASSRKAH